MALCAAALGLATDHAASAAEPAFVFREVGYFHRWSQKEQHEFTPDKQEDLKKWSDMMTVNGYPDVDDGDSLAATANAVLENYKKHQAKVLKTNSVGEPVYASPAISGGQIFIRTGTSLYCIGKSGAKS